MNNPKEHINDVTHNVKNEFSLNLDKIIESEFENAFENLKNVGIIEHTERKYGINNYVKPKLKISEDDTLALAAHLRSKNEIIFFKGSLKREIDETVKFLSHKEMETSISDIRYRILQYSI